MFRLRTHDVFHVPCVHAWVLPCLVLAFSGVAPSCLVPPPPPPPKKKKQQPEDSLKPSFKGDVLLIKPEDPLKPSFKGNSLFSVMGEDTRDYKYVTGAEQRLSIVDKVPFCSS